MKGVFALPVLVALLAGGCGGGADAVATRTAGTSLVAPGQLRMA